MSITSKDYVAFLTGVTVVYFILPKKLQWLVLLAASMGFYVLSGIKGTAFILVTAVITYFAALGMEKVNSESKAVLEKLDNREAKASE